MYMPGLSEHLEKHTSLHWDTSFPDAWKTCPTETWIHSLNMLVVALKPDEGGISMETCDVSTLLYTWISELFSVLYYKSTEQLLRWLKESLVYAPQQPGLTAPHQYSTLGRHMCVFPSMCSATTILYFSMVWSLGHRDKLPLLNIASKTKWITGSTLN